MERYYISFRCWEHFSADFPFEKFNDRPDDEINEALEQYAVSWRREHKSEFDRLVRERSKRLIAALKAKEKQRTSRPDAHSRHPHRAGTTQPGHEEQCSPGCQNAYQMGWISAPLREFGGLSPSPQWFLVPAEGKRCAGQVVDSLRGLLPSTDGWVDYGHLRIRFGYLPASRFDTAKRVEIELAMEDLSAIIPLTFAEDVQQQLADVAPRVVDKVAEILGQESGRPKSTVAGGLSSPVQVVQAVKQTIVNTTVINLASSVAAGGPQGSGGETGGKAPPSKPAPDIKQHEHAIALLFTEPDISVDDLAQRVGVHKSSLYRKADGWDAVRRTLIARSKK